MLHHHLLAIFTNLETAEVRIICRIFRPVLHSPLGLEPVQSLGFLLLAALVFKPLLSGLMPVGAKCVFSPVFVSNVHLAAHMDQARLRHKQIAVTELLPVICRNPLLRIYRADNTYADPAA